MLPPDATDEDDEFALEVRESREWADKDAEDAEEEVDEDEDEDKDFCMKCGSKIPLLLFSLYSNFAATVLRSKTFINNLVFKWFSSFLLSKKES